MNETVKSNIQRAKRIAKKARAPSTYKKYGQKLKTFFKYINLHYPEYASPEK